MSLTFPLNPSTGDTYTAASNTWYWDGVKWHTYGNQGLIGPAGATGSAGNDLPKITAVTYADSGYSSNGAASIAPSTAGYIYLTGSNFQSGCSVYVNGTRMTSAYVSSTQVNVAITGQSAASYHIYFYNPDGGTTVRVNGLSVVNPITITGGTVTYDGNYTVRTFNSSDTLTVSGGGITVNYLVVAGGGGGGLGLYGGGGGGAGGLTYAENVTLLPGDYVVSIGGGGIKAGWHNYHNDTHAPGFQGNSSNIFTNGTLLVSTTGGGGALGYQTYSYWAGPINPDGGSGAGGTTFESYGGGNGITGQGYNGGNSLSSSTTQGGAGGGGAGAVGQDSTSDYSGAGGIGRQISISGVATYYAGGGGGGNSGYRGRGGAAGGNGGGGGGNGGYGAANTGGGGGGGWGGDFYPGNGGSGVVIIRHLT